MYPSFPRRLIPARHTPTHMGPNVHLVRLSWTTVISVWTTLAASDPFLEPRWPFIVLIDASTASDVFSNRRHAHRGPYLYLLRAVFPCRVASRRLQRCKKSVFENPFELFGAGESGNIIAIRGALWASATVTCSTVAKICTFVQYDWAHNLREVSISRLLLLRRTRWRSLEVDSLLKSVFPTVNHRVSMIVICRCLTELRGKIVTSNDTDAASKLKDMLSLTEELR